MVAELIYNAIGPKGDKGPTGDMGPQGPQGDTGGPGTFTPVRNGSMYGLNSGDLTISSNAWTTFRWVGRSGSEDLTLHGDERGFIVGSSGLYFYAAQISPDNSPAVDFGLTVNNQIQWSSVKGHSSRMLNSRIFISGSIALTAGQVVRCAATIASSSTTLSASNSFFSLTSLGIA